MGILPLLLPERLDVHAGDKLEVMADSTLLAPRCAVAVVLHKQSGQSQAIEASAAIETQFEIDLLKAGGVIPYILKKTISDNR
jgi:aconitate hydratase